MSNEQYPTARKNGLVVQEIPGEAVVYDLDSNKAHCLNASAGLVWRSCDGTTSVSDIAKLVSSEMGGEVDDAFVWLAIDQLIENDLLEKGISATFAGQSRRDVLKKIGLASVVALPVIASLVAPTSIMAATCRCTPNTTTGCGVQPCGLGTCNAGGNACAPAISVKKG